MPHHDQPVPAFLQDAAASSLMAAARNNPHIVYHGDDLDGRGSAAIALRSLYPAFNADFVRPLLHAMSYNQPLPDLPPGCPVHLLDFSFPVADMEKLLADHQLTYIDHHAPRIAELRAAGILDRCHGLAVNEDEGTPAAIALAWSHYRDCASPYAVELLSAYDASPDHARNGRNWTDMVLPYQHGLRSHPTQPWDLTWDTVLDPCSSPDFHCQSGRAILRARAQTAALFGPTSCHRTELRGRRIVAGNAVSEDYFPHHPDYTRAEILLSYRYEPTASLPNRWKCTIWPGPDAPGDFHAGDFAKAEFAGGGHKGCAGFHLPFPPHFLSDARTGN